MQPENINKYRLVKKKKIKPSKLRSLKESFKYFKKTLTIRKK